MRQAGLGAVRKVIPLAALMLWGAWACGVRAQNNDVPAVSAAQQRYRIDWGHESGNTTALFCLKDTPDERGNMVAVSCEPSYRLCGHKFCDGHK
jgi:hypothetical protein